MKAELEFFYEDEKKAKKIAYLLEIDNRATPIKIKTENIGNKVVTKIEHKNLPTFLATIEDVIFCETIIEKIIKIGENQDAGYKADKRKS